MVVLRCLPSPPSQIRAKHVPRGTGITPVPTFSLLSSCQQSFPLLTSVWRKRLRAFPPGVFSCALRKMQHGLTGPNRSTATFAARFARSNDRRFRQARTFRHILQEHPDKSAEHLWVTFYLFSANFLPAHGPQRRHQGIAAIPGVRNRSCNLSERETSAQNR